MRAAVHSPQLHAWGTDVRPQQTEQTQGSTVWRPHRTPEDLGGSLEGCAHVLGHHGRVGRYSKRIRYTAVQLGGPG